MQHWGVDIKDRAFGKIVREFRRREEIIYVKYTPIGEEKPRLFEIYPPEGFDSRVQGVKAILSRSYRGILI